MDSDTVMTQVMPRKQVKKGNQGVRGGVNALVARIAHASVEGTAFIWTKEGTSSASSSARSNAISKATKYYKFDPGGKQGI
jgi:hypothetical protein